MNGHPSGQILSPEARLRAVAPGAGWSTSIPGPLPSALALHTAQRSSRQNAESTPPALRKPLIGMHVADGFLSALTCLKQPGALQ